LSSVSKNISDIYSKFIPPKQQWSPVDTALYKPTTFFTDYKKVQELLFPAIKHSFTHHYKNNTLYNSLCKNNDITPEKIKTKDDINKIPLLPDTFFKDYPDDQNFLKWLSTIYTGTLPTPKLQSPNPSHDEIIEALNRLKVNIMFTSGTSGKFSFIPRDSTSWSRLNYNAIHSVVELMNYDYNDTILLLIEKDNFRKLLAQETGIAYKLLWVFTKTLSARLRKTDEQLKSIFSIAKTF